MKESINKNITRKYRRINIETKSAEERRTGSAIASTHWARDKMAAISQTTLSIAFSWMKMFEFRLNFHWSLFQRVPECIGMINVHILENTTLQYIPRNMHTVFALLCFVVVIHWLIFPYPSGLPHWHCDNPTIVPVPAKQPWWIWINTSCEFIMNDCITTTKQNTTKPCAYFLGYTVLIPE